MGSRKTTVLALVALVLASVLSAGLGAAPTGALVLNTTFNTYCTAVTDAGTPLVVGTNCRTVEVGGLDRRYIVVVPPHGNIGDPHDVVVVFHGTGGDGGSFSRQGNGWTTLGATRAANFITVFPTATETYVCDDPPCRYTSRFNGYGSTPTANPTKANPIGIDPAVLNPSSPVDDYLFLEAIYGDVTNTTATTVGVDTDRVFAAGFSSGACMAISVGYEYANSIAAVAAVTGCAPEDVSEAPARYIPISYSINSEDPAAFGTGPFLSLFPAAAVASPFGVDVLQALASKSGRSLTDRAALQWPVIRAVASAVAAGIAAQYPLVQPITVSSPEQTWVWWAKPLVGLADGATVEVTIIRGSNHVYNLDQSVSPAVRAWGFFLRTVPR